MSKNNSTVEFIESKGKWGMKLGLENISRLLDKLDNPQNDLKFIHVAGSNGKGSVCRILESILVEEGYAVGMYTSPALEKFNERIRYNKKDISDQSLNRIFQKVKKACENLQEEGFDYPTGFEIETAIALLYFKEKNTDLCLMEVGLGGRLDATNIIPEKEIAIITHISLEHTKYLGDTLKQIASEKAAIIKKNCDVIIAPQEKEANMEIKEQARKRGARSIVEVGLNEIKEYTDLLDGQIINFLIEGDEITIKTPLLGNFQRINILTSLHALKALEKRGYTVKKSSIKEGLKKISYPGRFEILNKKPYVILDGAHNVDGLSYFDKNINHYFKDKEIELFFGMIKEKDINKSLEIILKNASAINLLTPDSPDAIEANEMKKIIKSMDFPQIPIRVFDSFEEAVESLNFKENDKVYAFTGSLYMIGKIRTLIKKALHKQS